MLMNKGNLEQGRRERCWGLCREGGRCEELSRVSRAGDEQRGSRLGHWVKCWELSRAGAGETQIMKALGSEKP